MTALPAPRGTLPVLQYCTPGQLAVDRAYQRDLDAVSVRLITRIARGWDWNLFQPLVVARRDDGALFVVDGQHRLEAARQRGDIAQLPCVIFTPADRADEAAVFVELNQQRRPLTAYALWRGALAAGDEQAMALDALLRATGTSFSGAADVRTMKPGQLNNVATARKWHARHGDRRTRIVLDVIGKAFAGQTLRIGAPLFAGVATIVLEHDDRLSAALLIDVLAISQDEWLAVFRRRAAADGTGLQAAAVAALRDAYAEAVAEANDDSEPATGDRRPATGDRRPATGDRRPATGIDLASIPSSMEQRAASWARPS